MPDKPKPRWYHLTPDRCVVGLLLVAGALFLSEWCCWFAFNEKKGWTVLIATGSVCLALLLMLAWFIVALIFRRRFQFSIRSLLVLVLLSAVVCSSFAVRMKQARRQRKVVAAISMEGGSVVYAYELVPNPSPPPNKPSAPTWLVNLLGIGFFEDVAFAYCTSPDFDDEDMVYLSELTNLEGLGFDDTLVTDTGLVHLKGLTKLDRLFLSGTQVTDSGLVHLKGLSKIEILGLYDTQVTDSGLVHLKELTNLQALYLGGTQVTDSGLEHLKRLTGLELLDLRGTQVTDTGVVHLKGLTNLELLGLYDTQVTDEGVNTLRQALPNCWISLPNQRVLIRGVRESGTCPSQELIRGKRARR